MKKKQVEKEQNNEKQLPRQETTLGEDIFQLLLKIVLIILAVILVFTFMYGMARINDVSMKPAIKMVIWSCIIDWTSVLCPVILQYLRKMAEQPQAGP